MLRDADADLTSAKVEVNVQDDDRAGDEDAKKMEMEIKFEKKPRVVHEIAGGRTDEELEAFYRSVHGKLAAHYPGTWLLVKAEHNKTADEANNNNNNTRKMAQDKMANLKREVNQRLKQETSAQTTEEVEEKKMMSTEEEEEKELEREEEEMDEVEDKAAQQQRRNPDRRKRAKLEIKLEQQQDDDDGGGGGGGGGEEDDASGADAVKAMTPAAKAAAAAAVAAAAEVMQKEGSKQQKTNVCGGQKTVLASLISTVLSQNTTDRNSSAAWANLQRAYNAKPSQLIDVIRTGGLAQRKSGIIQGLLNQVYEERDGELSLEHLRDLSTEEAKQELTKYKGIGPKTASCVLMFNMKRADFPVDTHVHRVSTRLGFVRGTTREQTYAFMNATMPDEIKRDMHVLLIRHGKQICKARGPKCGECVLRDDCRFGQTLKKKKTMKKELKLSDDDEEEEEELNDDDDDEEEEEKPTNSKRRGRSTAGRGGASKKGTKKAKREVDDDDEEEDDDDEDYGESRKKRTTRGGRKAKSVGGAAAAGSIKRVAKRRRSAPASAIGDIEDAA